MPLLPDSMIKVVNPADHDVDVVGVKFPPHSTKIMTFPWMMNHYGDPRSVADRYQVIRTPEGNTMGVPPRQVEVQRVNRMWNVGANTDREPNALRSWDQIPRLEFYTMEDERILTPFDDPTGSNVTPANTSVGEMDALRAEMEKQRREIAQLRELTGLDESAIPSDVDLPVDESTSRETKSPWAKSQSLDAYGD